MWPLSGVLAAILIVVGIVLLVAYAVRRGLVQHDLPDTIERMAVPTGGPAPAAEPASGARALGAVGAVVLVVGLALGVVTAVAGWADSSSGSGGCAQSWNGCPQQTAPAATDAVPSVVP
jgi:hypothetical protein